MKRRSLAGMLSALSVLIPGIVMPAIASYGETPFDSTIKPALTPFEIPANRGSAALWQSLKKLHTRASLIMITAHPDDEDGATLAYESRSVGARVTLLTLNRGEGGANVMSSDYWDALGLVRTEELLAAGLFYGVDQYWTRVCDYGFSKTMDEALAKWRHENLLADVVRIVRRTRPLVVTSVFVGGPSDGHGNHQVAGRMAKEVFEAAGDPNRFPEQIREGLRPWKPLKYYARVPWMQRDSGGIGKTLDVPVGDYSPLLGESFLQLSREGLGFQKSQNGGTSIPAAGPLSSPYHRFASRTPAQDQERTFFDGIDTSLLAIGPTAGFVRDGLLKINAAVEEATAQFYAMSPEKCAPPLAQGLKATQALVEEVTSSSLPGDVKYDVLHELNVKLAQFNNALLEALGVSMRATVLPDHEVNPLYALFMGDPDTFRMAIPGQRFRVGVSVINQSSASAAISRVYLDSPQRDWWKVAASKEGPQWEFEVTASDSIPLTRPYFTRPSIEQPYYDLSNPELLGWPTAPYPLNAWAEISYQGVLLKAGQVVQTTLRETGPGVVYQPLVVGPAISVQVAPRAGIVPLTAKSFELNVTLHSNVKGPARGVVQLEAPQGWRCDPVSQPFATAKDGENQSLHFRVIPASLAEHSYQISAVAKLNDREYREGYQVTGYPGLRPYFLYQSAKYQTTGVNVSVAPDLKIGYVMGSGDDVPASLEQLGIKVNFLTAADLAAGDLSRFDVVLLGVRAYAARPDLIANNQRLLDYVKNGGVAIVQYNTPEFDHNYGPYPYKMGDDPEEVTDENSVVTLLAPGNPVFNWPNKISEADFKDWIEERGSKFLTTWDPHYQPLLETHDPGQAPQKGGLLYATYGKGLYIYNAYAFYRELPEGVPGAFRLMANLLSLPKNPNRHAADNAGNLREALRLARIHRFEEADALLADASTPEESAGAVAFYRLRAAVDSGLKRPLAASEDMHKALDLARGDTNLARATAVADLEAGDACEAAGDSVKALLRYEEAVKLDPTQEQYRLSLAVELMQHNTFKPAAGILEHAAADFPTSVRIRTALGLSYYLQDDPPAAARSLLQAMSLGPDFAPPRNYLSQISLTQSDTPAAPVSDALCAYADEHPQDGHANAVCGALRLRLTPDEDPDKQTLERLAMAARLAPRDPLAHCEYGKALAKSNQLSKARTELEACVSLDPDSVEGHFRLARLYRQLGLTALAKEQADRRTHAEQHESARNEERYRNATAFLFTMQKLDSKP
jgi:LmbE family N-acetylglucosaminyl deacetylase/tetratricopeptide (TPR) repeat protein